VYIYIPKEKRTKLDPSEGKVYSESLKDYTIYFPGFKKMTSARM